MSQTTPPTDTRHTRANISLDDHTAADEGGMVAHGVAVFSSSRLERCHGIPFDCSRALERLLDLDPNWPAKPTVASRT